MTEQLQERAYNLGLVQGKAYRVLNAKLTKALYIHDLSIPEWKLLGLLWDHGQLRLARLADLLSVEAPLVTALVDRLEKKALVQRTNDPKDKRAKVISTTKKGIQLVDAVEGDVRLIMKRLLEGVTREELAVYVKVLHKIAANV